MKNYFKKLTIMFVMLLAVIGVGTIQYGTIANAATVEQQLRQPEDGWQRYDDTDNTIIYSNGWVACTTSSDYMDYENTFHGIQNNSDLKATVKFNFTGSKIRILTSRANPSNNSIIIDGNKYDVDSHNSINRGCYISFERLNLDNSEHSVEIAPNTEAGSYGYYGTIDAIDIDINGSLKPYKAIEKKVVLNQPSINLQVDKSQQLTTIPAGAQVTWTSSDSSIATVDLTGKVTGVKEGTCTITATSADGLTATCTVTVSKGQSGESISLNKSASNLTIGASDTLLATTTPSAVNVKWSSSNTSVATVDSTGKVTAMGAGTATITALTADGSNLSASCIVTVADGTNPNPTPDSGTDTIVNIAHAKGDNTNNAGGGVTITFHGTADTTLSVVKTVDVKDVWVGDNFTYTIVVTNTGSKTAKAVVLTDPAPNHIDFTVDEVTTTQGKVDSSSTSKNIIVDIGDIEPSGTVTIKIPATVIA